MAKGKRTCKNCKSINMKYDELYMSGRGFYHHITCINCGSFWGCD